MNECLFRHKNNVKRSLLCKEVRKTMHLMSIFIFSRYISTMKYNECYSTFILFCRIEIGIAMPTAKFTMVR